MFYFDARSNKSVNISLKLTSGWISCWFFWAKDRFSFGFGISSKLAARGGIEKYLCFNASLAGILLALSYLTNCLNKSTASSGASGTIVSSATGFVLGKVIFEKSGSSLTPGHTFSFGEPRILITIPSWSISFSPGKIGELFRSSPKIQPIGRRKRSLG